MSREFVGGITLCNELSDETGPIFLESLIYLLLRATNDAASDKSEHHLSCGKMLVHLTIGVNSDIST
jgi:hypothetical protein